MRQKRGFNEEVVGRKGPYYRRIYEPKTLAFVTVLVKEADVVGVEEIMVMELEDGSDGVNTS